MIALVVFPQVAREGRPYSAADPAEFETLVASLYGWVSALCPVLRPKQLATCLYAIARLELFNAELVASLAARAQQVSPAEGNGARLRLQAWLLGHERLVIGCAAL